MRVASAVLYAVGLPVLLIIIWWVLTLDSTNVFAPKPQPLVETFGDVWLGERLRTDVLPSLSRFAMGTALAIGIGVSVGLVIGSVGWLRRLTEPVLEFFRAIPPPVLVPVLMLILGVTDTMKVVVILSGALWPILLNTVEGVRAVDPLLADTCRSYRIGGVLRFRSLVLRSASPQIMTGVRQALSVGLILMVISEMFASSSGLGFAIVQFQRSFNVPAMWSGVLILGLIGVALSIVFRFVERRILRWHIGQREVIRDA